MLCLDGLCSLISLEMWRWSWSRTFVCPMRRWMTVMSQSLHSALQTKALSPFLRDVKHGQLFLLLTCRTVVPNLKRIQHGTPSFQCLPAADSTNKGSTGGEQRRQDAMGLREGSAAT